MGWYTFLIISHLIGTALGVGGATASDFLFFKSIKDRQIDRTEFGFLKIVSNLVWAGFLILVFSGFGFLLLYRLQLPALAPDSWQRFWAKMTVVMIIFLNGLVMHWKVFPLFEEHIDKKLITPDFIKKAPIVFTTGAISIISWYSGLILGAWRELTLSYLEIIFLYGVILAIGISVSNLIGRYFIRNSFSKK
ncbi:MAG TPA: hypothetical protein VGA49_01595 [Patescibacteria group bacterium]